MHEYWFPAKIESFQSPTDPPSRTSPLRTPPLLLVGVGVFETPGDEPVLRVGGEAVLPLLVFLCDALDPGNWHSKSLSSWEGWMVRRGREVAGEVGWGGGGGGGGGGGVGRR